MMAASVSPPADSSASESPALRPIACLRCRNRRSYCSKEKPKCSRCRSGNFKCVYEESRKLHINESYLRNLEAKAKAYDESVSKSGPSAPMPTGEPRGYPQERDDESEDDNVLLGPFTQLSIHRPSTNFKGPGSADIFLRSVRKLSGIYADDGTLDLNHIFYDPDALPSRREGVTIRVRLPPRDVARRLFAAQYTYIGTIFAFTTPELFDEELTIAYRGPPDTADKEACLTYAKVLVILAFGQLYSVNQWIDFKGPPGFEYFANALKLLPDPHEEGSILCVETLALTGYFMQNMNRRDAAFLYVGMALRMAISLGLHQEVTAPAANSAQGHVPMLDEGAREHRRRVWWSVYSLDRILSAKSGNPLTIQDEDIGVRLPSRLPTEEQYCQAVVLRHYTDLSRILSVITKAVYTKSSNAPKSGKRLMASVQNIILSLSKWNQELPNELRFDPVKLSISRESVSTFGHYYQCINMVARPLFYHVVQKRLKETRVNPEAKEREWKEGLSQTTVRVIEMCVSAAQDTIHMFTVAARRDLVATYGYMDTEHIFSAEIVLVMSCIAFPTNESSILAMRTGMELLRSLAQRGNSHMAARYDLLEHLRSVVMPGEGPPSPHTQPLTTFPHPFTPSAPAIPQPLLTAELVAAQAAMPPPEASPSPATAAAPVENKGIGHDATQGLPTNPGFYGAEVPTFTMVDGGRLGEPFFDESSSNGMDFMLWEEGFANAATFDAGYDITQWTQDMHADTNNSGQGIPD
ncbi:hypothetical protein GQ53DRAFT_238696 [Thozetella sp. PMI_491]|nr:hypothetical protein GQ53DRAFT_238696 [Thozetella sp. PMI_491]